MKHSLLLYLFLIITPAIGAQTTINGWVTDAETSQPIPNAICNIVSTNGKTIFAYGFAGKDGFYSLTFSSPADTVEVYIQLLGYRAARKIIPNKTCHLDFSLTMEAHQLKEVMVRKPAIYKVGDTINYNVETLKAVQDRSIGDVLKKLPGIEVSAVGSISYQGKPINKFYIEGLDLLEGKYGIATNNIPADAIDKVQILENHQPVKALREIRFTESAALNLKLKEGKKTKPIGTAEAGVGAMDNDALWLAELFAMQVGAHSQGIVTLKTNNTGNLLASEIGDNIFSLESLERGIPMAPENLLNNTLPPQPPVNEDRYLLNQSYLASVNRLWKVGSEAQLKINGTYLNESTRQTVDNEYFYFIDEENDLFLAEKISDKQRTNQGELSGNIQVNNSSAYIDNTTRINARWNDVKSSVSGTLPNHQVFDLPLFLVQNNFSLVKRRKKNAYSFFSYVRYTNQPQELTVTQESTPTLQTARMGSFYTTNGFSTNFSAGKSVFGLQIRAKAEIDKYRSSLSKELFTGQSTENHLSWEDYMLSASPSYSLRNTKVRLRIDVPFSFHRINAVTQTDEDNKRINEFLIEPSASFTYLLTPYWETSAGYAYKEQSGEMMDFAGGIVMQNYQTFTRGSGIIDQRTSHSFSWRLNYRNQVDGLFFYLSAIYRPTKQNTIAGYTFNDHYLILGKNEIENKPKLLLLNSRVSKYVDPWHTNLSISAGFTQNKFSTQQQSVLYPLKSQLWNATIEADSKVVSWFNFSAKTAWTQSRISRNQSHNDTNWLKPEVTCYFIPNSRLYFSVKGEYGHGWSSADTSDADFFFMDIDVSYRWAKWEANLSIRNLFDEKIYSDVSYSHLNQISTSHWLREQSILGKLKYNF